MHDGLDGGERIEVRIGCDFLGGGYVVTVPIEEPDEGPVDARGEDWGIYDGLPHCGRG